MTQLAAGRSHKWLHSVEIIQVPSFFSSVLQSRTGIQQWAWAPYCWSVTALLTIIWPWVQGSFESFWWWGRTDGQRQFIPAANCSRKEGIFIDTSAALKLDKGKTVFIHLPCKPRVLVAYNWSGLTEFKLLF